VFLSSESLSAPPVQGLSSGCLPDLSHLDLCTSSPTTLVPRPSPRLTVSLSGQALLDPVGLLPGSPSRSIQEGSFFSLPRFDLLKVLYHRVLAGAGLTASKPWIALILCPLSPKNLFSVPPPPGVPLSRRGVLGRVFLEIFLNSSKDFSSPSSHCPPRWPFLALSICSFVQVRVVFFG